MIQPKKALIVGATGLIGSNCLKILLNDSSFSLTEVWTRKPMELIHPRLKNIVTDFRDIAKIQSTDATHIFCCLGTTIAKAGSQSAFREVDFEYVLALAKLAERSDTLSFSVISSIGANPKASNFYLRTKGEMEEAVNACSIPSIIILRPSMLLGKRQEFRFGEMVGKALMLAFNFMLVGKLRKYRGIQAVSVASAMVRLAKENSKGIVVIESDQIHKWQ